MHGQNGLGKRGGQAPNGGEVDLHKKYKFSGHGLCYLFIAALQNSF